MFPQFPRSVKVILLSLILGLERLSYYGVRGIAVVYFMEDLSKFQTDQSTFFLYYSFYTALAGILCLPAGVLSDFALKHRIGFTTGAILCVLGYGMIAIPGMVSFGLGALLIIGGTSFTRVNIQALTGFLFSEEDSKREAAFSISYLAINVGALFASLTVVLIGERYGFGWGCGFAAMNMLLALVIFLVCYNQFGAQLPAPLFKSTDSRFSVAPNMRISHVLGLSAAIAMFWLAYEQIYQVASPLWSTMIEKKLLGITIDAQMIDYINPLSLIPFTVLVSALFYLVPIRRVYLIIGVSLFALMGIGVLLKIASGFDGFTQNGFGLWVVMLVFISLIEALVAPLALSQITRLGGTRYSATALGFFIMGFSLVSYVMQSIYHVAGSNDQIVFWLVMIALFLSSILIFVLSCRKKRVRDNLPLDAST